MIDPTHYRELVLRPTLQAVNMWSKSSENLYMIIPLVESNLTYLEQIGGGGALSLNQIEKATYYDCQKYLNRRTDIKETILSACYLDIMPPFEAIIWNMRLSICIARLKFWRKPEPLPHHNNAKAMWEIYKMYYNTPKGDATPDRFYRLWETFIAGYYVD
jgi:hypothetical protein